MSVAHKKRSKPKQKTFRPKTTPSRKARRAVCACRAQNGEPKTLYPLRHHASRAAVMHYAPGKMWQVYKCPEGDGYHVTTVRWDPWEEAGLT